MRIAWYGGDGLGCVLVDELVCTAIRCHEHTVLEDAQLLRTVVPFANVRAVKAEAITECG